MRFLGNKELIIPEIYNLLNKKNLLNKNLTLFDAFCGTGSVSNSFKDNFHLIINDNLQWCITYTLGRLLATSCNFKKLGFNPFNFFNTNNKEKKGFFYRNYSPGGSQRMFFTPKNAARIDFFRSTIEDWKDSKLISSSEYTYLLACLIESTSSVSNTAGVYGAFLKHWDPRSLKDIVFSTVLNKNSIPENFELFKEKLSNKEIQFYNERIEDIIPEVKCDVLYLDPPYTQNQYGTQYHLLETLVLNDNPSISKVTGSRKTAPMRSNWSKNYKSHILLDKVLAKTQAKYILLSYSKDGFMSKDFIEASFKRYGKHATYVCNKLSYKKYKNFKNRKNDDHFEYLFFIEKKDIKKVYFESPLNYIGSKSKIVSKIIDYTPDKMGRFVDAFGGGFNVGVNINAKEIVYNDVNHFVKELVESFRKYDTYEYIMFIKRMIKKFGLEISNSENYLKARSYYNSFPLVKRDPRLLYTIILYGFQQQIRFNSNHNFNNPVGMRWFNDKVLEKFISFSRVLKERNFIFKSKDFLEIKDGVKKNDFIYMDPPYRLTSSSYNDGKRGFKGWTKTSERKLCDLADELNKKGNKFMISYVIDHGGKINGQIKPWIDKNKYKVIPIEKNYKSDRNELLIINYNLSRKND